MVIYTRKRTLKPCLPSLPTQLPSPPPSDPLDLTAASDLSSSPPPVTQTALSSRAAPPPLKRRKLTQMLLDLGGPAHARCAACGMEYAHACAVDAALHRRFHAAALGGLAVPRAVLLDASLRWRRYPRLDQRQHQRAAGNTIAIVGQRSAGPASAVDRIVCVCRGDGRAARAWAQRTLAFVEGELGAVETSAAALWGEAGGAAAGRHDGDDGSIKGERQLATRRLAAVNDNDNDNNNNNHEDGRKGDDDHEDDGGEADKENAAPPAPRRMRERFHVHLYVRDGKCVGLLLAEAISHARRVLPPPPPPPPSTAVAPAVAPPPLRVADEALGVPAALGVSRIWVSREWRRSGVATRLLDAATGGARAAGGGVAFSQPTEAGAGLARRWFGKEAGWLVY